MQGGGPMERMRRYLQYSHANGLPQGRVLRVVSEDGGEMSLGQVTRGPFDPSVWKAPEGYRKQQMPMMRQR